MDDTIINSRQKRILELINQQTNLSRLQIKEQLPADQKVSTATVARDLSVLLKNKLVLVAGQGRGTVYLPINQNPLLHYFDLEGYFTVDPDERPDAQKTFNFDVFSNLKNLFGPEEIDGLNKIGKSFSKEVAGLNSDIYRREIERFVIELAWKSSKIEGNTYSLLDTETLIKQKIEAAGHPKDEATMILNHKQAFETILANQVKYKKLTLSQITELHNFLVKGLNVTTGIRTQAVGVTGTTYRPLSNQWQIREALEKLIAVINKTRYPLEKALITVAMISYIQPFADGNKRTGRMLANALLLANDFYPLSYRSVDETTYKKALVLFYEQNSLYSLKEIVINQYQFALKTYFK